ncbi:hypothetical protein AH06_199 [Erwinia phage AH06]|nr:hypothetical protein AH06_199 [Erwinia phage AH06]
MSTTINGRRYISNPGNLGAILTQLIGGGLLPVGYFNKATGRWDMAGEITDGVFGGLSAIIDHSDIPQEFWPSALVIDIQQRIKELWPALTLVVRWEPAINTLSVVLENEAGLAGSTWVQPQHPRFGLTYETAPDGQPRRANYTTDISKLAVAAINGKKLLLVHADGRGVTEHEMTGGLLPEEELSWVVTPELPEPQLYGVRYADLAAALKLTGHDTAYSKDGTVEVTKSI